jgi:MerR family transcriptional regulator, light-induced transcriptional regulator
VADDESTSGLPIQDVSRLLGVPAPTLRAWELRYGIPETPRSAGGHRRYSPDALHRVRLMRDEIMRGRRAADAAGAVRTLMRQGGPARALVEEIIAASERSESRAVGAVLDRATEQLGLPAAVDEVLMPAMRRVGLWETGTGDISAAHRLTTEGARAWVSKQATLAGRPTQGRPVVLACGPRDTSTLRLEALALLLTDAGSPCHVLGARTAPASLVAAVHRTGAAAAVVVSNVSSGRRPAVDVIRSGAHTGVHLFFGGDAFLFSRARQGVPGTYLDGTLSQAAEVVRSAAG